MRKWRVRSLSYGVIVFAVACSPWADARGGEPHQATTVEVAANELAKAVRNRDIDRILTFIDKRGVMCVDTLIPRAQVERQLRNPKTWLHAYFLQAAAFRERHADKFYKVSLAEIVAADDWTVEILPDQLPDFPCVHFTRRADASVWAEICFVRRRAGWVLRSLPSCL